MDDAGNVGRCQCIGDLLGEVEELVSGQRTTVFERLFQGVPVDILEHQVWADLRIVSHIEYLNDIRMLKASRGPGLVLKSAEENLARLGIKREIAKRFHCDRPVQICIARQIDVSHRTCPKEPVDAVAPDLLRQFFHGRDLVHAGARG